MSKRITLILTLVSLLAFAFATAFAPVAQPQATKSVKLISVVYQREKGIVFRFQVTGAFKKSELTGKILVDGDQRTLFCPRKEANGFVLCTAQRATAKSHAGKSATVVFAGFSFPVVLPDNPNR